MAKKERFIKWQERQTLDSFDPTNILITGYIQNVTNVLDGMWRSFWRYNGSGELNVPIDQFEALLREASKMRDLLKESNVVANEATKRGKKYLSSMYMRRKKKPKWDSTVGLNMKMSRKINI